MNHSDFEISVEQGHLRSKKLLTKKGDEYAPIGSDRLVQFHKIALVRNTTTTDALTGLAIKSFTAICDMAVEPSKYTLKEWREKTTDLRNYTHLLDAVVEEMLKE